MTKEKYVSIFNMFFSPYHRTFVDQLPQLEMNIIDKKKEKYIDRVSLSKKVLFIFPLCDKVHSQWLIYSNLAMLGYKIMTLIIMIIMEQDYC